MRVQSDGHFNATIVGSKKNRVLAIDLDRCKGCSICVTVCPYDTLEMSNKKTHHGFFHPEELGKCVACRECVYACPDFALSLHILDEVKLEDMNKENNVKISGEIQ